MAVLRVKAAARDKIHDCDYSHEMNSCVAAHVVVTRKLKSCQMAVRQESSQSLVSSLPFRADSLQPALVPSLFPNVPPTLNFVLCGQKGRLHSGS